MGLEGYLGLIHSTRDAQADILKQHHLVVLQVCLGERLSSANQRVRYIDTCVCLGRDRLEATVFWGRPICRQDRFRAC